MYDFVLGGIHSHPEPLASRGPQVGHPSIDYDCEQSHPGLGLARILAPTGVPRVLQRTPTVRDVCAQKV